MQAPALTHLRPAWPLTPGKDEASVQGLRTCNDSMASTNSAADAALEPASLPSPAGASRAARSAALPPRLLPQSDRSPLGARSSVCGLNPNPTPALPPGRLAARRGRSCAGAAERTRPLPVIAASKPS